MKTRKNVKSMMGMKAKSCKFQATMKGLLKWYKSEFEKLGWMVLAAERDPSNSLMKKKVEVYKESLQRLHEKIMCKMMTVEEKDRRDDLEILMRDLLVLINHVKKHL
jgi:hypothetical protein